MEPDRLQEGYLAAKSPARLAEIPALFGVARTVEFLEDDGDDFGCSFPIGDVEIISGIITCGWNWVIVN